MARMFDWVLRYGYAGIFALLVAGIIGLPVPDETLLTFAGYLVYKRILGLLPTLISAFAGSLCGITVSFVLGRTAGLGLLRKYGRFLHLPPERISRVHQWFARIGRWTLLVGYYVPGFRHLVALVAGASGLRFGTFALFAYSGALVWSCTFICVGLFFGRQWPSVLDRIHGHVNLAAVIALGLLLAYLFVLRQRANRERQP